MKTSGIRRFASIGVACLLALTGAAHGQWTTSGSNIYYNSGNVGVGLTSPLFHMHVSESSGTNGSRAIYGICTSTSGVTNGVYGSTASTDGRGVIGVATSTTGDNFGVAGNTSSGTGRGVNGYASATSGINFGVFGTSLSGSGYGVYGWASAMNLSSSIGIQGESNNSTGAGVVGVATATGTANFGVIGQTSSIAGIGVLGSAAATTGTAVGVYGQTASSAAGSYGVFSAGNSGASGTKSFCIDHPADPQNRYLLHYSVESPEVLNCYSGKIQLDGSGGAVIELPAYFARVNRDARYLLTAVGQPMPMLYVAEEVKDSQLSDGAKARPEDSVATCSFRIAGGMPGGRVSWRVEAVRNDRWIQVHGAPVEAEKAAADRGTYLQPELFGKSAEYGTHYHAPVRTMAGQQPK